MADEWDQFKDAPQAVGRTFAEPRLADANPNGPSWSDVPRQAIENFPSSARQFAENVVQPILHPIDTANAFKDLAVGMVSKLGGAIGIDQDPTKKASNEAVVNAVADHFASRYGSVDGFKRAIASDPVGVMGDVSMVLSGGGAAAARFPASLARLVALCRPLEAMPTRL